VSEGIGNTFCNECDESDTGSTYDDSPEEIAAVVPEWIAYRAARGMATLQEADRIYLGNLAESIARTRAMAAAFEQKHTQYGLELARACDCPDAEGGTATIHRFTCSAAQRKGI
jgi:hypothetical protein